MGFLRICTLAVSLVVLISCANVPSPREESAVPAAPIYAPTAEPSPTPLPPLATPTILPGSTPSAYVGAVKPEIPTTGPYVIPITPIARHTPIHDLTALSEYQRGIAYVALNRDEYRSAESEKALDELFATGANFMSLLVTWYQVDVNSLEIYRADNTPSDEDLAYVIEYAHKHGVKILLKPQVDFSIDKEHWRGQIHFNNERDWNRWFASYREFILHYAQFAQENGVEEFSVGTELVSTSTRTADWRALIQAVRKKYTGLVTYSANHSGEEVQVRFWNDLDFIGVNVFYHITNYRTPTMQQILDGWKLPVRQLTNLHNAYPKQPIIFTEVGYPSKDLASVWPWNWEREGALDIQEQTMLYQGLFATWWYHPDREWFRGMFIWNWVPKPDQGGMNDANYTPHGKPAEEILKYYYEMPKPLPHTNATE